MSTYFNAAIYWPLPLVFWPIPVGIPFWIIFLWARASERRILSRARPASDPAADFDKGSWPLINHGWRLVRLSALVVAFITPPWTDGTSRNALYCSALILMIIGALLRQHSIRMLGDHFTYRVRVSEKSEIIKRGIYRWVRHPSYTGGMLYNLGIGLALTNWGSAILVVAGMCVMYIYRVHVEEKALLRVHQADYSEYMRHTHLFFDQE
ncbi:MAG: methyltransferase family protein, partial [Candidatus Binatia bacterium]